MKLVLPSSKINVQIGVHHRDDAVIDSFPGLLLRGTRVRLTLEDGSEFQGGSVCKPPDAFCKRFGRKYAANSLLRNIRDVITSKEDRQAIFTTICPEFKTPTKRRAV